MGPLVVFGVGGRVWVRCSWGLFECADESVARSAVAWLRARGVS